MPVATIARSSRRLNTAYGTYFVATYFRDQALESRTIDQTRTRASQIVVDDHDLLETQRACPIGEATLQACAFLVVNYLTGSGLANVNGGFSMKSFRREFRIHPLLRFLLARFLLSLR